MERLSAAGQAAIDELAQRHGFSGDAVLSMLNSVIVGNGTMAQFNHPEFGGSGQWMRGGMIMTSDMFNHSLKGRVDTLCLDLAGLISSQPEWAATGSHQSQSQGGQQQFSGGGPQGSQQSQASGGAGVSLFVPAPAGMSSDWWGCELGRPASTGAQNNVRYAFFPHTHRLAIELHGQVTVYDTLDHQIGGFSQQQSQGASLTFTSQHGRVEVASLPVVHGAPPAAAEPLATVIPPERPQETVSAAGMDIFATLEKLAALHGKGILTDEEFASKKAELLSRL